MDIYTKLIDLREEDQSKDTISYLKKQQKLTNSDGLEEDNFFLEDEIEDARTGKGYKELEEEEDDNHNFEQLSQSKLTRQEMDAEKGYFLQPIYTQSLDRRIYFNSGQVSGMFKEFKDRLVKKRQIIEKMKYKCKEMSLKDVTLICDKC